jgi:hypothetical protein
MDRELEELIEEDVERLLAPETSEEDRHLAFASLMGALFPNWEERDLTVDHEVYATISACAGFMM